MSDHVVWGGGNCESSKVNKGKCQFMQVQIVQMPLELGEASAEQLRMLTLSPQTEASREVGKCSIF